MIGIEVFGWGLIHLFLSQVVEGSGLGEIVMEEPGVKGAGVEKSAVGEIVWSHGIGLIITTQKSNRFSQNFCAPRHHMYHHNVPYGVLVITHKRRVTKSGLSQTKVGMCS